MKTRKLFLAIGLIVMLGTLGLAGLVAAADDAVIYVDSTLDVPDVSGDQVCSSTPSGKCTLRAAVMFANERDGEDTIEVKHGTYELTRNGAPDDTSFRGDLDITEDVVIHGGGRGLTHIDGKGNNRILDVQVGTRVEVSSITLRNGVGGGVDGGSGIRARGDNLILEYVIVQGGVGGAAILNEGGDISLWRTIVQNNQYGPNPQAGGIHSDGVLIMDQSLIYNNYGFAGGGLALYNSGVIVNSTISGNKGHHRGGGIEFGQSGIQTGLYLSNVTITRNHAQLDPQYSSGGGGGVNIWDSNDTVFLNNTIIAQNVDEGFADGDANSRGNDCVGHFQSNGYNLIGDSYNCVGPSNGQSGDKVGSNASPLDAKLNALADNGGFTDTHSLKDTSPAIDSGDFNDCKDRLGTRLNVDQRGFARHINGDASPGVWCDIGAFEKDSPGFPTKTPTVQACNSKPAAPTLDIPANNAQLNKRKVNLDWTGFVCTTKYKVLVKMDATSDPKADKGTAQTSSFITDKLLKGHDYYWRVKACNDFGCTKSPWQMFRIN